VIKVLYVDDQIEQPRRDAQHIKQLFEQFGDFACELRFPPKDFSDLPQDGWEALLIDFDLKGVPQNGEPVNYYGSTLASEVRMRYQSRPIVLITRAGIIQPWQRQLLEKSIDVDYIVLKDEIEKDPGEQSRIIRALIEGFAEIAEISGQDWSGVLKLMGATEQEAHTLREASPPIEGKQWNIPQAANWIRNVVMGFPGILYDDLTSATRLGLDLESFTADAAVKDLFEPAKYRGVFHKYQQRWWRNRLFNIAQTYMVERDISGAVFQKFADAFEREYKRILKHSVCVYDGTEIADWVCYIYNKPVKQRNSIPYYPDNRPAVMDQARVSFKAIQESNDFDASLVDADSYEIVQKLWK